jgi:hypothetical protein
MASAARRGTGIAGLVWRTSNLSVSAAPTIRMYSNSAPVFAAAMRIPASFPRFAGLTSRRWMSTEKEGEVGEGSGTAAGTANEAADATSSVQTEGGSLDDTPDPVYDPVVSPNLHSMQQGGLAPLSGLPGGRVLQKLLAHSARF